MYICIGIFQSVHKVHGGHCQVHHVRNRTEQFSWSMSQSPIGPVNTKTYMMVCLVFTTLAWRTTKYNLPNIPRILFTSFFIITGIVANITFGPLSQPSTINVMANTAMWLQNYHHHYQSRHNMNQWTKKNRDEFLVWISKYIFTFLCGEINWKKKMNNGTKTNELISERKHDPEILTSVSPCCPTLYLGI